VCVHHTNPIVLSEPPLVRLWNYVMVSPDVTRHLSQGRQQLVQILDPSVQQAIRGSRTEQRRRTPARRNAATRSDRIGRVPCPAVGAAVLDRLDAAPIPVPGDRRVKLIIALVDDGGTLSTEPEDFDRRVNDERRNGKQGPRRCTVVAVDGGHESCSQFRLHVAAMIEELPPGRRALKSVYVRAHRRRGHVRRREDRAIRPSRVEPRRASHSANLGMEAYRVIEHRPQYASTLWEA